MEFTEVSFTTGVASRARVGTHLGEFGTTPSSLRSAARRFFHRNLPLESPIENIASGEYTSLTFGDPNNTVFDVLGFNFSLRGHCWAVNSARFVSQVVRGVMANDVSESIPQGMDSNVVANGVSESILQGMGSGFIVVGVNEFLEASGGMRANSVSGIVSQRVWLMVWGTNGDGELVPEGVVNGVRINGVSRAGRESVVNGVRTNGVGELVPEGVRVNGISKAGREFVVNGLGTNGVGELVPKGVRVNGVSKAGQAASRFSGELDKERLLAWFNQEVVDDLGTLREYQSIARGLRVSVRRRRDRIRQLALLRNCQDAAAFWERMQLEDVEKGTYALRMMKETQTKIDEKASFILNLRRGMEEAAIEDLDLAREIDGLCAGLTARIDERKYFIDELDVLVDEFMPEKMFEFIKETQEKDRNRLMKLQILGESLS
nr:hypothetical protein [Tanacetum cinerariifolium]GEX35172.1 hypothetical protein [Tanacetum cinerariifolium]